MTIRTALHWIIISIGIVPAPMAAADTGPEYLEQATAQDPLSAAFELFTLPFSEEQHSLLHLRSIYLDSNVDGGRDAQDWAGGGWLNLVTDFWQDRIKLGATGYTSQKLWTDDDKISTGLLQPNADSYSSLGEVYGSLTLNKFAVQAGRYLVNMPYVNAADSRMTPNTFQGAQLVVEITPQWTAGGGVLSDIKRKTSTDFVSLYEAAGLQGDEDINIVASIYELEPGTSAGAYYMHAPDFINGAYIELSKRLWLGSDRYIQLSGQYTRQQPEGAELAGDIDAEHYGLRATWKHDWYSGSLAWTDYPDEHLIRSPWGGIPGYTSVMIKDFNRPQETAWLLGATADLSHWGAEGLELNVKYIDGDTPDCGISASPDQSEWDLNLNYSPPQPALAGLGLRLRFGWVDQENSCNRQDARDVTDIRLVLNYEFEL
jgi:hypothetical protein